MSLRVNLCGKVKGVTPEAVAKASLNRAIPAPIAYIKVVAVKKLVVGPWGTGGPVCREGVH